MKLFTIRKTVCVILFALCLSVGCRAFSDYESDSIYIGPNRNVYGSVKSFDLEGYINEATERYYEVNSTIYNGGRNVEKIEINSRVKLYTCFGKPIRLEIEKGFDDLDYAREFTYDSAGRIMYCRYESDEYVNRLYFYNDELVKITFSNKRDGSYYEEEMAGARQGSPGWEEYGLSESRLYLNRLPTREIKPYGAVASSVLNANGKEYSASNVIDENENNSWQEGVDGDGIGEYITIYLDRNYNISLILCQIGYAARSDWYYNNNRPEQLKLVFSNGSTYYWNLNDTREYQYISFNTPENAEWVRFEIKSVYPGDLHDAMQDTCISNIRLFTY